MNEKLQNTVLLLAVAALVKYLNLMQVIMVVLGVFSVASPLSGN
jgi:hypothetical protein